MTVHTRPPSPATPGLPCRCTAGAGCVRCNGRFPGVCTACRPGWTLVKGVCKSWWVLLRRRCCITLWMISRVHAYAPFSVCACVSWRRASTTPCMHFLAPCRSWPGSNGCAKCTKNADG